MWAPGAGNLRGYLRILPSPVRDLMGKEKVGLLDFALFL